MGASPVRPSSKGDIWDETWEHPPKWPQWQLLHLPFRNTFFQLCLKSTTKFSKHPQVSCGERFGKLHLRISRNSSQPASLPKSCRHLQMASRDCRFPICLGCPPCSGVQAVYWRWLIRKTVQASSLWQLAPGVFAPRGTLGFYSFIFRYLSVPIEERIIRGRDLPGSKHCIHVSENAFGYETLDITFLHLVTWSCMWSQRWQLIFPLQKCLLWRLGALVPFQVHLQAAVSRRTRHAILGFHKRHTGPNRRWKADSEGETAWGLKSDRPQFQTCFPSVICKEPLTFSKPLFSDLKNKANDA